MLGVAGVVLAAVTPLAGVAVIGAVIAEVPQVARHGIDSGAGRTTLWLVVAAGSLFFVQSAVAAVQAAATNALGARVDTALQRDLMRAVMAPQGIGHLEDPGIVDLIDVGRDTFRAGARRPGRLAATMSGLVAGLVVLVGSGVVVARFHVLLGLLLVAAGLWAAHADRVASRKEAAHHHGSTQAARRTQYFYDLAVTPQAGKEIRVFGLSTFVLERLFASWQLSMVDVLRPSTLRPLVASIGLGVVILGELAWVAGEAVAGRIGAAGAAIVVQALMVSLAGIRQSSWSGLQTELSLATLRRFDNAVSAVRSSHVGVTGGGRPAAALPRSEIRFERVSFSYPGDAGGAEVLRELDLVIPAGQSLAIVGANGVGKTTLVTLLCRMYEPTGGRITVDGIDLRDVDVASWRGRLAAVFQDSTRFALSAARNIGFGRSGLAAERGGIERAARDAGVADRLAGLPRGWDTVLSSEFPGGVDLSGGEWQKVGLARALFKIGHGASVLILDEPAAQLDVRAEARLYEQFLAMTKGLTTIVISHRFSTVRQASSIVVLAGGRVAEQGSHDELLERNGAYAEMFRLQAARFTDTGATRGAAGHEGTSP